MHFKNFAEGWGVEEFFFFLEGELDGKGVINFWRGLRFLEITIVNFTL